MFDRYIVILELFVYLIKLGLLLKLSNPTWSRRSHRRGPVSIPGVGIRFLLFHF